MRQAKHYSTLLTGLILAIAGPATGQVLVPSMPAALPSASQRARIPRQITLDAAEGILLQNNLTIMAARYGVDIARAQRLVASLRPNPVVTFGAEQFDVGHPGQFIVSTNSNAAANRVYTYRYDQVFERGNKRELRTAAADLQLRSAEAQVLDAARTQMLQLKQAFTNAVLARDNLRVANENLASINSTEQLIKLHVSTGDTAEWDLIKFQSNRVQYQRDLITARLTYEQSTRDLVNLMGAQPSDISTTVTTGASQTSGDLADAPLEVIGDLSVKPVDLQLDQLQQAALTTRPDVIAAQRAAEAAQKSLDLAYALRHRDVDIALEYQREGGENTVGVVVSVPLFIHNNHQGDINQALAQLSLANTQLNQARLQALTDVDKGFKAYQLSRQMLDIYNAETLLKAEQSLKIAGVSYKEGASSLLELQDAQRTYNQMRVTYNQAHFDYRMSLYQIEAATGKPVLK
jgi:cobalt-zinc-cadmium efflux system outer membrane protein